MNCGGERLDLHQCLPYREEQFEVTHQGAILGSRVTYESTQPKDEEDDLSLANLRNITYEYFSDEEEEEEDEDELNITGISNYEEPSCDDATRKQRGSRCYTYRLFCIAFIPMLVIMHMLGLFSNVWREKPPRSEISAVILQETGAPSITPIVLPTPANIFSRKPEAPKGRLAIMLSRYTSSKLLKDESAAQGKAFQWVYQAELKSSISSSVHQLRQRYALMTLYFATNPDKWEKKDGWESNDYFECIWHGIEQCRALEDGTHEVVAIDLCKHISISAGWSHVFLVVSLLTFNPSASNSLNGALPPEICLLESLEELELSDNSMNGSLPSCLVNLVNLRILSLAHNSFTGLLPRGILTLPNIGYVDLESNKLTGSLDRLFEGDGSSSTGSSLRSFIANDNHITGDVPQEFSVFDLLTSLILTGNDIEGEINDATRICKSVRNGSFLSDTFDVDCDKVLCSCCTRC